MNNSSILHNAENRRSRFQRAKTISKKEKYTHSDDPSVVSSQLSALSQTSEKTTNFDQKENNEKQQKSKPLFFRRKSPNDKKQQQQKKEEQDSTTPPTTETKNSKKQKRSKSNLNMIKQMVHGGAQFNSFNNPKRNNFIMNSLTNNKSKQVAGNNKNLLIKSK